jgi:hypothetical protein
MVAGGKPSQITQGTSVGIPGSHLPTSNRSSMRLPPSQKKLSRKTSRVLPRTEGRCSRVILRGAEDKW